MKLLPRGRYLPVHCCCEPGLRLGWVPAPGAEAGPVRFLIGHRKIDLVTGDVTEPGRIYTTIAVLQDGERQRPRLAVKSAELPVETWRKVPGFIEDRRRI